MAGALRPATDPPKLCLSGCGSARRTVAGAFATESSLISALFAQSAYSDRSRGPGQPLADLGVDWSQWWASCPLEVTPNLRNTLWRWYSTVAALM